MNRLNLPHGFDHSIASKSKSLCYLLRENAHVYSLNSRSVKGCSRYRVGQKVGRRLMTIIMSNLNQFKKSFTGRFLGNFVVERTLKISLHLAYAATALRNINLNKTRQ